MSENTRWLIETKLSPPTLKSQQIQRSRLVDRLKAIQDVACVIFHAPAGYGKTTLLRQLYAYQNASAPVAWLSLDEDDRELPQFYTYLLASLERALMDSEFAISNFQSHSDKLSQQQMVVSLINDIGKVDQHLVLILDDYHNVDNSEVRKFLQAFMQYQPDNITLVISSRVYPELGLEQFRAQGMIIDIDAADLRFDTDEVEQIFGDNFSSLSTHKLMEKTEGWPIALGMVKQMKQNQLLDENRIENISGRTSELAAYITEQILPSLSDAENEFLMQTSLLNRFTGDLADVLCDDYDGWQVLESLAQKELFLIPLDTEGRWYRYHQIFCEYLRERMQRTSSKKATEVHQRASNWFFENRFIPEAIEHAVKSQDLDRAAAMLDEVGGWRLIYEGKLDFVAATLDRLPRRLIKVYPRLLIADILRFIKQGEMSYVERQINELRIETKGFTKWQGGPMEEQVKLDFSAVINMTYEDYIDEPVTQSRIHSLEEYEKRVDPRDHILNALIKDALAYHAIDSANFDAAARYLDSAEQYYQTFDSYYGIIFLYFHRVRMHLEQVKVGSAREALDKAEKIIMDSLGSNPDMLLRTHIYRAEVAYFSSDLDMCEQYLDEISDNFEEHDGWFDLYSSVYLTRSAVYRRRRGLEASLEVLSRARITSYERKLPRLAQLADLAQVNYLLLSNKLEEATSLAVKLNLLKYLDGAQNPDRISINIPTTATIVVARLWILSGQLQDATELLEKLSEDLQSKKLTGFLIPVWLLMARACFMDRRLEQAVKWVNSAVNLVVHEGYKTAFIEEGESMLELYEMALDQSGQAVPNRYSCNFLNDVIHCIQSEQRSLDSLTSFFDLTEKEVAVIRELASGLSNKEIARRLFISQDTVKYRLKKVFSKWQVDSRDEAVRLAVERGLAGSYD